MRVGDLIGFGQAAANGDVYHPAGGSLRVVGEQFLQLPYAQGMGRSPSATRLPASRRLPTVSIPHPSVASTGP
jgi:hypothetical protein